MGYTIFSLDEPTFGAVSVQQPSLSLLTLLTLLDLVESSWIDTFVITDSLASNTLFLLASTNVVPPITPDGSDSMAQWSADKAATAGGWESGAGAADTTGADTTGGAAGFVVVVDVEEVDVVGPGTAFELTVPNVSARSAAPRCCPWGLRR